MKKVLFAALTAILFPAMAGADYVCRATYFPYVENTAPGRMKVRLSSSPSCAGTVRTLWFCDKRVVTSGATCAGAHARYDSPELLAVFQQAASAADSQEVVFLGTTTCSDGLTQGCGYYLEFAE